MRRPISACETMAQPNATADELRDAYYRLQRTSNLSAHTPALRNLVRNPNCPPDLFFTLLPEHRNAALLNPAWPLYLLADTSFLTRLNAQFVVNSLRDETTPKALIEALALHPSERIASAARRHVALVGEAPSNWMPEVLADWTTRLWRDGYLVWLMRANALPKAINQRLPYPIAPQPILPPLDASDVLRRLAAQRGSRLASVLALMQTSQPPESLVAYPHWEKRLALALNPKASAKAKAILMRDGHHWVRAAARS
jgi:hypothetical protein